MAERLFSSVKKLSSCEGSMGGELRKSWEQDWSPAQGQSFHHNFYFPWKEVEGLSLQGGTRLARGNYCRFPHPPTAGSPGQGWSAVPLPLFG